MLTRILPLFFFAYFVVKKGLTAKFTKSTKVQFHAAFSILLLFIAFGCAKKVVEHVDVPEIVVSEVIDIGQVRAKDSPVNTSFTIANRSTVSVEIDEILSGCGCTVIDLPSKTIRPNETLEVPVKIDVFGRKGDFSTDLLVRSTSGESWNIHISGQVIEDLWYAGQSIRFHIDRDQEVVSKDCPSNFPVRVKSSFDHREQ